GACGHPFETIDDVCGVRPRARQGQGLARTSIEGGESRPGDRQTIGRPDLLRTRRQFEQPLELGPLLLIELFEVQWCHQRRPSTHCATPSTRRVTSGPERPASPDTDAASAASSSSRSIVNVGARAARAMTAAWSSGASALAGATGATL